jgi:hypothetical protein
MVNAMYVPFTPQTEAEYDIVIEPKMSFGSWTP